MKDIFFFSSSFLYFGGRTERAQEEASLKASATMRTEYAARGSHARFSD
jgi:hypothetical protein